MLKSLVLGAILGAITAFLWSFISWSVLPWHQKQLRSFRNEDEVTVVIASHALESGNYILQREPVVVDSLLSSREPTFVMKSSTACCPGFSGN
jgi:hypothetical protein